MVHDLTIGDVSVDVVFKDIKNVHLSVYPPTGRVRVSAPRHMTLDTIRLFAISKIGWIKKNQRKVLGQERETPREYLERESHYLWGRRYLLHIVEGGMRPSVSLSAKSIELCVPENAAVAVRQETLREWYRSELRAKAAPLVAKWASHLGVKCERFFIQAMRTKWGSSNPQTRTIRLNLDLARFPAECLDYVVLHEIAHFIVPNHSENFKALLDRNLPGWSVVRDRLNDGPLAAFE